MLVIGPGKDRLSQNTAEGSLAQQVILDLHGQALRGDQEKRVALFPL